MRIDSNSASANQSIILLLDFLAALVTSLLKTLFILSRSQPGIVADKVDNKVENRYNSSRSGGSIQKSAKYLMPDYFLYIKIEF